ncbi:MAG: dihydroorotate dehydrogenase [Phycisphaerales bacterium]|jgi:dihydroorotate dehydrogenase (NAD+) catalytic subunit|nr:dihydroorotate dehydrogenase [Phycisphaerales bacterium]
MDAMEVNIGGISLRNPIILAAGTSGVLGEIADAINLEKIGAITTKSITQLPRKGNEPVRMVDLPNGMLNAIGLANGGIEEFIQNHAPRCNQIPTTIIGSVAGDSIDAYCRVAKAMDELNGIDLIELNVSCPNTSDGLEFGSSLTKLTELLQEVKPSIQSKPMIVKLSAAGGDIRPHAEVAVSNGADALTLINTIPAMAIHVHTNTTCITRGIGGLSGPAIHPIAVKVVHEVYRDVAKASSTPIIGTGGVMQWEDAAEFILAGATAVGIGTASFVNPKTSIHIAKKLSRWVAQQGCSHISELVGQVL